MIGRLVGGIFALVGCLAFGTLLAQAVIYHWLSSNGRLTPERMAQIKELALGRDLPQPEAEKPAEPITGEQPSIADMAAARALRMRRLELREQQLREGLSNWRQEREKIDTERQSLAQLRSDFEVQLKALRDKPDTAGQEAVRAILAKSKPKDAKKLLVEMINKGELEQVVALVAEMPLSSQTKIIAEFKGDEVQQADEILRRIRVGTPVAPLVNETQQALPPGDKSAQAPAETTKK